MNLFATAPIWALIILGVLLAAAAAEDVARLRISNLTIAGVLLCGLAVMVVAGFPLALWENAVVFAILLIGGTLLFAANKIGGGDVKLLAALGLWVDLAGGVQLVAAVFIAGGVIALLYLAGPLLRGKRAAGRKRSIPYGLAIVAGAVFMAVTSRTPEAPTVRDLPLTIR